MYNIRRLLLKINYFVFNLIKDGLFIFLPLLLFWFRMI